MFYQRCFFVFSLIYLLANIKNYIFKPLQHPRWSPAGCFHAEHLLFEDRFRKILKGLLLNLVNTGEELPSEKPAAAATRAA